ncbi:MAG TPA: ABC transporter substrate-binding protein, partial [Beijerinckiaceae bacterium]|nr:ABC transporter substrate-binding protein [Beijerinckiaceae bacterium]
IWSELGNSYNSDMLSAADAPKTWLDLCNPRYKGTVSFEPLELRFLAGLDAILGEDKLVQFLQCMGKNAPIIMRGHSARMTLMLAGDHAINSDNYFYEGFKARRDHHAPFMPIFTAPLMGYGNGVFINKDAVHPYAAALYVDWALSDESQNFAARVLRNPITQPSPVIPESAPLVTFSFPDDALRERLENDWKQYMVAK